MRRDLPTKRQRQILEIIRASIRQRAIVPTYAEIARALGLKNRSGIQRQLESLERQGLVEITGVRRGIRLLGEGTPLLDAGHPGADVKRKRRNMRWDLPTKKQRQILEVIRASIRERALVPTYAEIARAVGVKNASAIRAQLRSLERQGLVELTGVTRGVRLLGEGTPVLDAGHLAAMNNGAADAPRLKDHESLLKAFPVRPDFFARVGDEWLDTADFAAPDILAVRTKPAPRDGDVVLARVGQTPTLARLSRIDAKTTHLHGTGADSKLKPVTVGARAQEAHILGTVVGAIVGTRRTKHG